MRQNKLLNLVTMPRKWNNQDTGNNWEIHHGKVNGGNMQANGVFPGDVPMPNGPEPYRLPAGNGTRYQTPQGKGQHTTNP